MSSQETLAQSAATQVMDMTTNLTMKIDLITRDISRTYLKARLYAMAEGDGQKNALTICNYITAELNEINIKPSTREDKIKTLVWLSEYHKHKPFEDLTKTDILDYLNRLRRPLQEDPTQRWLGSKLPE